ncbi:DNA-binding protein [Yarrowia sp. C11]|nr:DNA-binding protein [Yarrowia sp. C11]KAG5364178.1 DNA-binding protein [Yarrowia sp. E02]
MPKEGKPAQEGAQALLDLQDDGKDPRSAKDDKKSIDGASNSNNNSKDDVGEETVEGALMHLVRFTQDEEKREKEKPGVVTNNGAPAGQQQQHNQHGQQQQYEDIAHYGEFLNDNSDTPWNQNLFSEQFAVAAATAAGEGDFQEKFNKEFSKEFNKEFSKDEFNEMVAAAAVEIGSGGAPQGGGADSDAQAHGRKRKRQKTSLNPKQDLNVDPVLEGLGEAVKGGDNLLLMDDFRRTAGVPGHPHDHPVTSRDYIMPPESMGTMRATGSAPKVAASKRPNWTGDGSESGGAFTLEEIEKLEEYIEGYCQTHVWDREMLCQRVWSNERKKDHFWDSMAGVLPHRTRASVYKHVRRAYHVYETRAKWTPDQDKRLGDLVGEIGPCWKDIGQVLNRMPEDCRDRWRNYVKCGNNRASHKWTASEENRLYEIVRDMLSAQGEVGGNINWTAVSERMNGTRSRIQCRYKWKKLSKRGPNHHAALTMTTTDHQVFLKHLDVNDYASEEQIDWQTIAAMDSRNLWAASDLQEALERLKKDVADWDTRSFRENIQLLAKRAADGENLGQSQLPGQPQQLPGAPMAGAPMQGQPLPGQQLAGQPMAGQPLPGQPPHGHGHDETGIKKDNSKEYEMPSFNWHQIS